MKRKKLLLLAAVLGVTALSNVQATALPCDVYCPTATGHCSCPSWSDKPGFSTYCKSWYSITAAGCFYE
jgi:hypothetical protein